MSLAHAPRRLPDPCFSMSLSPIIPLPSTLTGPAFQDATAPDAEPSGLGALWQELSSLATIDQVGLGLVVGLLALGLWRGLWWQVMRLLGLVGAVLTARWMAPKLAPRLSSQFPDLDERLAAGLPWLLVFLLGLAAAVGLAALGRRLIEALQLGLVDRCLGAVVGAASGALVHAALVAAIAQLAPTQMIEDQLRDTWSEGLLEVVGRRFPLVVDAGDGTPLGQLFEWPGEAAAASAEQDPAGVEVSEPDQGD